MTAVLDPTVAPSPVPPALLDADAALDRAVRTGAMLLMWAGLLLVTYWWDAGGGITDLGGWASGLTSVGVATAVKWPTGTRAGIATRAR